MSNNDVAAVEELLTMLQQSKTLRGSIYKAKTKLRDSQLLLEEIDMNYQALIRTSDTVKVSVENILAQQRSQSRSSSSFVVPPIPPSMPLPPPPRGVHPFQANVMQPVPPPPSTPHPAANGFAPPTPRPVFVPGIASPKTPPLRASTSQSKAALAQATKSQEARDRIAKGPQPPMEPPPKHMGADFSFAKSFAGGRSGKGKGKNKTKSKGRGQIQQGPFPKPPLQQYVPRKSAPYDIPEDTRGIYNCAG